MRVCDNTIMHAKQYIWKPGNMLTGLAGYQMGSIWVPCGLSLGTMRSQSGYYEVSVWAPYGYPCFPLISHLGVPAGNVAVTYKIMRLKLPAIVKVKWQLYSLIHT